MSTSATSIRMLGDRGQSRAGRSRFGDDFVRQLRRDVGQQVAQSRARRRFVVDDHHASGGNWLPQSSRQISAAARQDDVYAILAAAVSERRTSPASRRASRS
jgi:hypothetical protein